MSWSFKKIFKKEEKKKTVPKITLRFGDDAWRIESQPNGGVSNLSLYANDELIFNGTYRFLTECLQDGLKNTTFRLTEKEQKMAEEFEKNHRHKDVYKGAIGGHITYSFTPTSLGDAKMIKCGTCGEEKNITDYNCW